MQPTPPTPPRGLARVLPIALFLVTFVTTIWALDGVLPSGDRDLLTAKLELFEEREKNETFDVVFVGSSRTYHGLMPTVFDERMRERGHAVNSFNLGITGQMIDGSFASLRSLDESNPNGLRYVFVDVERVGLMLSARPRAVRGLLPLHDVASTKLLLEYLWSSRLDLESKYDRSTEMLRACAYNATNVGRGTTWLDGLLGRGWTDEERTFVLGPDADGWRSKDIKPKPKSAESHRKFLADPGSWHGIVARLAAKKPGTQPLDAKALPLITRISELTREMGAEPIFYTTPSNAYQGQIKQAKEFGHIDSLFSFNDPNEYRELYLPEARWEAVHLSAEGARRFSIAFAERFADWLDERAE